MQNFAEKHHLNKAAPVQVMNLFDNHAMSHVHKILKNECCWIASSLKLHRKIGSVELVDSSDSFGLSESYSNPPPSCLPHTTTKVFKDKCNLLIVSLFFLFYYFVLAYYNHFIGIFWGYRTKHLSFHYFLQENPH